MSVNIKPRQGPKADWDRHNPILGVKEIGIDTTNMRYKVGNGVKKWNDLVYNPETLSSIWLEFNVNPVASRK